MDGLLARWIGWVGLAEVAGFSAPALAAVLVTDDRPVVIIGSAVAAGAVEGLALGAGQVHVLRTVVPAVDGRRWVLLTGLAAAAAWSLAMTPFILVDRWDGWPLAVQVLAGLAVVAALLSAIGLAQWTELRHHLPRAGWWVAATAAAWAVGLIAFTVVTTPLWHEGQRPGLVLAIGMLGALAMAGAMAATTGLALRRLLQAAPPSGTPSGAPTGRSGGRPATVTPRPGSPAGATPRRPRQPPRWTGSSTGARAASGSGPRR